VIKADFVVYGITFAEIERNAEMIAQKFHTSAAAPYFRYSCEQLPMMGRWKAEVEVVWDLDE